MYFCWRLKSLFGMAALHNKTFTHSAQADTKSELEDAASVEPASRRDFIKTTTFAALSTALFSSIEINPLVAKTLSKGASTPGAAFLGMALEQGTALDNFYDKSADLVARLQEMLKNNPLRSHHKCIDIKTQADFDFWFADILISLAQEISTHSKILKNTQEINPLTNSTINPKNLTVNEAEDFSELVIGVVYSDWKKYLSEELENPDSKLRKLLKRFGHTEISDQLKEDLIVYGSRQRELHLAYDQLAETSEFQETASSMDPALLIGRILEFESNFLKLKNLLCRNTGNNFLNQSPLKPLLAKLLDSPQSADELIANPELVLRSNVFCAYNFCCKEITKIEDRASAKQYLEDPIAYSKKHELSDIAAFLLDSALEGFSFSELNHQNADAIAAFQELDRDCRLCLDQLQFSDLPLYVIAAQETGMWYRYQSRPDRCSTLEFLRLVSPTKVDYRGQFLIANETTASQTILLLGPKSPPLANSQTAELDQTSRPKIRLWPFF